jgi:hypothetical protein
MPALPPNHTLFLKRRTIMAKHYKILLLGLLLMMVLPGAALSVPPGAQKPGIMKPSAEFEGGKLYRAGAFSVLELKGSYRQMGRQYGMLLKDELNILYDIAIEKFFIKKRGMSRERLTTIARAIFDRYPQRYKEIIKGISETSGLGIENQILLNAVEWYPKINHLDYGACSGIAAWGPYTSGGPLVFGRNNDDDPLYREFARFLVVVVFKPAGGGFPAAVINYAGAVYNPTGMNSEGLFLEMNAGPWMGFSLDRISIFTTLFSFLQDYASIPEVDRAFRATLTNISAIVNVADRNGAVSYESSLYDTRRVDSKTEGLLAMTNHFVGPDWNLSQINDRLAEMTITRRGNLLLLGDKYKGTFNPKVMMKVLDTKIGEGGATVDSTIYQVIAVPERLTLWLKVPGIQDWTEIRLGPLFREK